MFAQVEFPLREFARNRLFEGQAASGGTFRRWLAKVNDADRLGLPETVFHYRNGHAIRGVPQVRFVWYPGGLRLVGIGRTGTDLVREVAPTIGAALMRHSKSLISPRAIEGQFRIQLVPMALNYFAPSVVVSKDTNLGRWLALVDEAKAASSELHTLPAAAELLEEAIDAGLRRQIEALEADALGPFDSDDDASVYARNRSLGVKVTSVGKHFLTPGVGVEAASYARRTGTEVIKPLLGVRNVEFTMRARLAGASARVQQFGPWATGRLQSRGYGCVFASRASR